MYNKIQQFNMRIGLNKSDDTNIFIGFSRIPELALYIDVLKSNFDHRDRMYRECKGHKNQCLVYV